MRRKIQRNLKYLSIISSYTPIWIIDASCREKKIDRRTPRIDRVENYIRFSNAFYHRKNWSLGHASGRETKAA